MKMRINFFKNAIICASMLLLVMQTSAYSSDKDTRCTLPAIQLLLNGKITVENAITKALAKFGDEVNAAMAILLSADQGYSWIQIVDAIDAGTLYADGSITGITPQEQLIVRQVSLRNPYESANDVDKEALRRSIDDFIGRNNYVLATIMAAMCKGYSGEQINWGFLNDALTLTGAIECEGNIEAYEGDIECEGDYYDTTLEDDWKCDGSFWVPALKGQDEPFKNCASMPSEIQGIWESIDYDYIAIIRPKGFKKYSYSGIGGLSYKHDGTIEYKWINEDKDVEESAGYMYHGTLKDDPDVCCGNNGEIWLRKIHSQKIQIRSLWKRPDGSLLKKTDWEYLFYEGEVD